jgi:hypothetical protein
MSEENKDEAKHLEGVEEVIDPKFFLLSKRVIGLLLTSIGAFVQIDDIPAIANLAAILIGLGVFVYGIVKRKRPLSFLPWNK